MFRFKISIVIMFAVFAVSLGTASASDGDNIILSGLMYDRDGFQSRAIVNGEIVKIGDNVAGVEVVDIRPDSIIVKKDKDEFRVDITSAALKETEQAGSKPDKEKTGSNFWANFWGKIASFGSKSDG